MTSPALRHSRLLHVGGPQLIRLVIVLALFLAVFPSRSSADSMPAYAATVSHAPVLNTRDFRSVFGGKDSRTLAADSQGQIRALEFIALPGTSFRVEEVIAGSPAPVYRVTTDDYPYPSSTGYFIDSRFVRTSPTPFPPRRKSLPDREKILSRLASAVGTSYVWGGNWREGIREMLSFYPPRSDRPLDQLTESRWTMRGLDCSGLLYEATDGFTPRNTSSLVEFGDGVPIEGKGIQGIAASLRPLDLIAWKGHVIIVFDEKRVIESSLAHRRGKSGVAFRGLVETLKDITATRTPLDSYPSAARDGKRGFVVRRWHPLQRQGL
ncbi:MAG: peptidoglycan endopeptidase [Geobacteraceae bacterium]|nr:peptidoglycan endopeptidase [Geobacteraceae bacterium]